MDEGTDLEGRGYRSDLEPDIPFAESTVYEEGVTWGAPETTGSYTSASNAPDDGTDGVRTQIEQTRSELGQTIDAIQQKLSPSNIADEAKSAVHDATVGTVSNAVGSATNAVQQAASGVESTAAGMGSTVVETIKQNPIPAALAGIGLGWLIVSARQQAASQPSQGYQGYTGAGTQGYSPATNPYGWYDQTGSGYSGYPDAYSRQGQPQSQGGLSGTVDQVQGTVGQAVNQVQDTAGQVVDQASQSVQGAATGLQEMMRQRPLAVGLMAVGLGAAIGLAVPETRKEDEIMGSAREDLMQRAQQTAQQTMQKVETVAQHTVDAAKQEAKQEVQKQGL